MSISAVWLFWSNNMDAHKLMIISNILVFRLKRTSRFSRLPPKKLYNIDRNVIGPKIESVVFKATVL